MKLSEELAWRGFTNQTTLKDTTGLDEKSFKFYWGVDPSAPSMTIGNLAAAMMAKHFIRHGHQAYLLIGGATGMIGDPDGKKTERVLKPEEEITANKAAILEQYRVIFAGLEFTPVDNWEWFKGVNYISFLREVGKHVPMRQMLGRDFIQARLNEDGAGISYAEFSYVLIQAYDFLHLHRDQGVELQICGSDQWGNSIAGVDLIRRITGDETHVWSAPLVINKSTGQKFGKTEDGAVWLDASLTTPYKFYQFWLNTDDEGVEDYLKIYTELSRDELEEVMAKFRGDPRGRYAQKKLAYEVTRIIHGDKQAGKQQKIAEAISAQDVSSLKEPEIAILQEEMPYIRLNKANEFSAAEILVKTGLATSNTEARRLLEGGSIYVNGMRFENEYLDDQNFISGRLLLRRGKAYKDSALVTAG